MTLVRWDPFRDLFGTPQRDDVYGAWAPAVDIFERGDDLVVRAEVPGVEKDDLTVRVENGTLILEGERKRESGMKEEAAYRLERTYGKFSRSFRLPTTVDASKISASYRNGILEVALPKIDAAKPRQVDIKVA